MRAAFAGPPEPDFSFSAFLLPARPLACVDGLAFSHPVSPLSWFRSQLAHTPPTGLVWGFAGVVSLSCPQTGQKSPHRSKFGFSPQNELTPPPKGGGAGYRLSWVCWVCPARAQLPHTAPTGPFWGLAGIRSLLSFQNRTQGHTGPSLVFTAFSWCALGLAKLPNPAPACIPLLPGWVGSCNANSRSAPSLPLFLPS